MLRILTGCGRMRHLLLALPLAGAILGAPTIASAADPIEDFYKGRTVSLVVSSSTGGGYDTLARMLTRYLTKHIPGQPTIVIRNMPGAGGIVATNHLYTIAPRDGSVIGAVQNNTPFEPLFGTKEATYDPTKFNWLGSPSVETSVLTIWHTSPVNSIQDAQTMELKMGSSGANSTPSFYGRLLNETLGLKLKLIVGYPGQNDALLAMERGELDGYPSVFYNSLMATRPNWLPQKQVKLLVQYGAEKLKELPDTPFIFDLLKNEDDSRLWRAAVGPIATGRPYLLPPGVPQERVDALRKAFWAAINDPEFLAEQAKARLGADTPRSGQQIQDLIAQSYTSPPAVIDRLRKLQTQH
ncbi:MAG: tripartite tricarboxylate transporter substrate-binding protein [Beijerinckiaceae bacterium]|nr:tripartite tricarboxylate transporter substrate-binding protein [Beijerinckiaceae bacterium]